MKTFIITEKQNTNPYRDGEKVESRNLTTAKIHASKKTQVFAGTVMTIENESREILSVKEGPRWNDNPVAELYK